MASPLVYSRHSPGLLDRLRGLPTVQPRHKEETEWLRRSQFDRNETSYEQASHFDKDWTSARGAGHGWSREGDEYTRNADARANAFPAASMLSSKRHRDLCLLCQTQLIYSVRTGSHLSNARTPCGRVNHKLLHHRPEAKDAQELDKTKTIEQIIFNVFLSHP